MPFSAPWMDLEITILSEVSQTKIDIIRYHLCVELKEMLQMNLFIKQKKDSQTWGEKKNYGYHGKGDQGGMN